MAETIWATATGERQGLPIIYRYLERLPAGLDSSKFPDRVELLWSYEPGNNGMPDKGVNARQVILEDLLEPAVSTIAELALVRTGAGEKEWIYYSSDSDEFIRRLNAAIAEESRFPIEISIVDDPEWSLYYRFWNGVDRSTSDSGN